MDGFNQGYFLIPSPLKYLENVSRDLPSDSFLSEWYFIIESKTSFYLVRKPRYLCWGWWKYLQRQEHQLLLVGGFKALPFLTEFTLVRL
jgi:hypothetical protein